MKNYEKYLPESVTCNNMHLIASVLSAYVDGDCDHCRARNICPGENCTIEMRKWLESDYEPDTVFNYIDPEDINGK